MTDSGDWLTRETVELPERDAPGVGIGGPEAEIGGLEVGIGGPGAGIGGTGVGIVGEEGTGGMIAGMTEGGEAGPEIGQFTLKFIGLQIKFQNIFMFYKRFSSFQSPFVHKIRLKSF